MLWHKYGGGRAINAPPNNYLWAVTKNNMSTCSITSFNSNSYSEVLFYKLSVLSVNQVLPGVLISSSTTSILDPILGSILDPILGSILGPILGSILGPIWGPINGPLWGASKSSVSDICPSRLLDLYLGRRGGPWTRNF